MVKGGFQGLDISGVDLTAQSPTLPGAYATCAGADGKPIRVQTADGQVECSVKKVSTNYVLAGVTGDGKILSITVGSTDGISVSEAAIPSGVEPDLMIDYGNAIDLTTYNSNNRYIAPADGYARCRVTKVNNDTGDAAFLHIRVKTSSTFTNFSFRTDYSANGDETDLFFVKKGFQLFGTTNGSGTGDKVVQFLPLIVS